MFFRVKLPHITLRSVFFISLVLISFNSNAEIKRPLVFIPGIAGSQLESGDQIVWGNLSSIGMLDQLYIEAGPRDPDDNIIATEVIKGVSFLGIEFKKQYSPLLNYLVDKLGYEINKDFFIFPYDWRRSNLQTAKLFEIFIEHNNLNNENGFDVLAHSMGGIVGKLYILDNAQDHNVSNFITMGTPYYGSIQMLDTIIKGWGNISLFAGGSDRVRKILLSFPSVYELLPHYERCCVWGKKSDANRVTFNMININFWQAGNWFDADESIWLDQLRFTLQEASKVHSKMVLPLPEEVILSTISGTGNLTKFQVYIDPAKVSKPTEAVDTYTFTDGDSTVTRPVASFGRIASSFPSWNKHGTVFDDETAKRKLRDILLNEGAISPDNISAKSLIVTTVDSKTIDATQLHISMDKVQYQKNEPIDVEATIVTSDVTLSAQDSIRVRINSANGTSFEILKFHGSQQIEYYEQITGEFKELTAFQFKSTIKSNYGTGLLSVSLADSNGGNYSDDAIVVSTQ